MSFTIGSGFLFGVGFVLAEILLAVIAELFGALIGIGFDDDDYDDGDQNR